MFLKLLVMLECSPGCCQLLFLQECIVGSGSVLCPLGPPGPFLPSCFPVGWPPASTGASGCFATATEPAFPAAGLHKIPAGLLLQLVESPESSSLSTPPPGFVSSAY